MQQYSYKHAKLVKYIHRELASATEFEKKKNKVVTGRSNAP